MAQAGNRTGFWRSVRELPGHTPLRVKLITAVLALVILALAVISFAGVAYIKGYLINRADSQLQGLAAGVEGKDYAFGGQGGFGPQVGEQRFVEAILPSGQVVPSNFSGPTASDPKISVSASWLASHAGKPIALPAERGSNRWRVLIQPSQVVSVTGPAGNQNVIATVVVGIDVTDIDATIARLETFDVLLSVGIVLILALLATAVVRASLRPLNDIEETAGAIAAGNLSMRVPDRDPRTEVGRLGRSLNVMLSQIESAFQSRSRSEAAARRSEERMRQFVADASHELRTPLTAIRGFAEYYRQRGGIATGEAASAASSTWGEASDAVAATNGGGLPWARPLAPADMDRIMRRVEQESARMGVLVEDMLLLARLDQQRPLMASPVDLLTLAADAIHDARVVAPARSINLTVSSGRALLVIGDEVRLRQVIGNLMSNALTHTPDGTPIDVLIRSGNLDEAAAATVVARPDVAEPSLEDEPTTDNRPAADNRAVADNGGAADDGPAEDDRRAADNSSAAEDWAAADNPPATDNGHAPDDWATAAGDMQWDAEHVPPAPGSATVSRPEPRVPSGPAAVLEVTDHGPGLTTEQAGHVFERFYRADPARTTGGTGLGLAIVAALVAAHGGAAWVRSRPGEGATFCIALPLSPEAMQGADNDFDGDADDVAAEAGTVDTGTGENGPAQNGPAGNDAGETRINEVRAAESGAAYTASARPELGG